MMNINAETGELINSSRSPRFTLWVAFLVFATITMGSAVGVVSRGGWVPFLVCHLWQPTKHVDRKP